jgi:hypothetical protein
MATISQRRPFGKIVIKRRNGLGHFFVQPTPDNAAATE